MTSRVTRDYVEECSLPGSQLRHAVSRIRLPEVYSESYGRLQLDRPVFADESEINSFSADLSVLFAALTDLPARICDGDLRRYCAELGMDEGLAELMCRGADQPLPVYARADAYHDGDSFRLLELNIGSELGGIDAAQLNRALLEVPSFADFAERHRLGHLDTLARVARTLRRAAEQVTAGEPAIALIESTGGLAAHEHVFTALREAFQEQGVRLLLGEIQELGERNGKLTLRGTPLDVLLRYFVAGELVSDPAGQRQLELVLRAHRSGRTVLFAPLHGAAFASKGSLAMLHDPRVAKTLTPAERAAVDRVLPWTRLLADRGESAAERAELFDRCLAERENLVLKPGVGYGGVGTVIGHQATEEEWREALRAADGGDHVVQERVRPAAEPVVDAQTGEIRDWVVNWGIFLDPDGYAGGFVRALKPGDGAVVSYSNPGTRGTCVFTAP